MDWDQGVVGPVALDRLGQRYRRYRLADPAAEEAMAGSLRRWGQLSPVVACRARQRVGVARWLQASGRRRGRCGLASLSVRVVEVDERMAKAAILGLNRGQRGRGNWRKRGSYRRWCAMTA